MDYVTRQFINLTKKFRKEIPKLVASLHKDIQQQTKAIREVRDAYNQSSNIAPVLRAELQVPHPIEVKTEPKDKKTGREWYKLVVETLTLLGILAYAVITIRMWHEMIFSRHQTQHAVEAAQMSAAAAQRANDDAERRFQLEERAYLVARDPKSEMTQIMVNGIGHIEVTIDNLGKGVASSQRAIGRVALVDFREKPSVDEIDKETEVRFARLLKSFNETEHDANVPKRDVVPGQKDQINAALVVPIDSTHQTRIINAQSVLLFFGLIRYESEGQTRTTEFCWFLDQPVPTDITARTWTMRFILCKDHNTVN